MSNEIWLKNPMLVGFDGEGSEGEGGEGVTTPTPTPGAAAGKGGKPPAVFSQDDVNKFLAEDRRKHAARVAELETQYKQVAESKNLTDQEKNNLLEQFDLFKAEFRTKEETLEHEKARLQQDLKKVNETLTGERDSWKNRYESTEIRRALTDAASAAEAYRAEHVLAILQPHTKMTQVLDSNGKATGELAPRVHYTVTDPKTGDPDPKVFTAADAVAFMKSKPEEFGHLFRSPANGGLGGTNGTGSGNPGRKLDVSQMDPAEYRKMRKENPAALYGKN